MTKIQWTDETWNPIVGCSLVSPGCTNCYAMRMAARLSRMRAAHYSRLTLRSQGGPVWSGKVTLAPDSIMLEPLRWRKPRRVFVNSMGDLFHEEVPDDWIDAVFAVMALTPEHTYQILTKRPKRMADYCRTSPADGALEAAYKLGLVGVDRYGAPHSPGLADAFANGPLANVWLGVSAEDQTRADERIPILLDTPAAVRFVSAEPLLGPIDFTRLTTRYRQRQSAPDYIDALRGYADEGHGEYDGVFQRTTTARLDWVIVGGESGPNHRPFNPDWARAIRDQCRSYDVPFFMKQLGGHRPRDTDIPGDLMIREYTR